MVCRDLLAAHPMPGAAASTRPDRAGFDGEPLQAQFPIDRCAAPDLRCSYVRDAPYCPSRRDFLAAHPMFDLEAGTELASTASYRVRRADQTALLPWLQDADGLKTTPFER